MGCLTTRLSPQAAALYGRLAPPERRRRQWGSLPVQDEAVNAVRHEDIFRGHGNERADDQCAYVLPYCRTYAFFSDATSVLYTHTFATEDRNFHGSSSIPNPQMTHLSLNETNRNRNSMLIFIIVLSMGGAHEQGLAR